MFWLLIIAVIAALSAGIMYAAPEVVKPSGEVAQSRSGARAYVTPTLALLVLLVADAAVFHGGLYSKVLKWNSSAGGVAIHVEGEVNRVRSGLSEIAVMGDSRLVQGFSARLADELSQPKGFKFAKLAVRGTYPCIWYYMLREVDPSADRYRAIVIPFKSDDPDAYGNMGNRSVDISMAAPLLQYTDAFSFAASFREWKHRYAAFTACILRGSAYRADLADLLQHPAERLSQAKRRMALLGATYHYDGRQGDLSDLSYDTESGKLTFPPNTSSLKRLTLEQNVKTLQADDGRAERPGYWTRRIVRRYEKSRTALIFFRLPRGPLASVVRPMQGTDLADTGLAAQGATILNPLLFADLERPEYYFDANHPNAMGRQHITERLVGELLSRLDQKPATGRLR